MRTITSELANKIISDCARKAQEIGKKVSIAICDPGGTAKAFLRMDGAPLLSVTIAQDKAYTAVAFGISTDKWHEFIKNDPPLATGIVHVPRLIIFGGGYPIVDGGELIGSIGVSGGHYSEDMECARYALEVNNLPSE
ncbi:MAG: heme-binding protein [Betaproteobacteria bacterium]|nr:heme-binding protein [Betaproteobacteria bacterium]